jgi:xanthine dehydrogenase accessory factor
MTGSDQVWSEAVRALDRGKPFALATVINVRGSTPREIGAKMIVREDGQFGTIGGGCGEAEVFRKARMLLEEGSGARLAEVDLTGDFDQREIGTCGGIMDVFVDIWSPQSDLPLARRLADSAEHSRAAALLTLIEPGAKGDLRAGAKTVIDGGQLDPAGCLNGLEPAAQKRIAERVADSIAGLVEIDPAGSIKQTVRIGGSVSPVIFIDPIAGAQRLIIAGAGHIAVPLASLGSMLGFHVTVIDDRASFANRERFPEADAIIVKPFATAVESLRLDRHCYLISVTRGHAFDEETLRAALKNPNGCFIGMIGSRRRVKATLERFAEDGVDPRLLDEIHAPLGLDIGAETPEEIALAIMGEIVRERRTGVRDDFTLGTKSGRLRRTGRMN